MELGLYFLVTLDGVLIDTIYVLKKKKKTRE